MAGIPTYKHIVVVFEENHSYDEIAGNPQAPYINSLMASGANLINFHAITHPSQPNYFALYAGSTFGTTDDNPHSEPDPTIDTVLKGAGLTFTGYVDQTQNGSDFNHDPWVSFPEGTSVQTDITTSFLALFPGGDYSSLPSVAYVVPNDDANMHSGTIAQGDQWLQNNLSAYAQWAVDNDSLLVVVWDESDSSSNNPTNQVAAILYGAHVVPGNYNTSYNDYNLLSTILGSFGLTAPNNAATAAPIQVFGTTAPAAPTPTITSPANGSTDTTTAKPAIAGTGVSGDTVTVSIDETVAGTAPVVNGVWSFTPTSPLSNASHTVSATQAAAGGLSSTAATDTFTVAVRTASDPATSLHYTSNGNFVNGRYAPGADGFNLADVSSASQLSELPSGVKALAWLGMTDGVTAAFKSAVESFARSSQVYGFYLADEPSPSATTAANFKAESDWIHAYFPGAKTFIIEQDSSSELTPSFYYTPANTHIDLFGLDPYPVNSNLPGGFDLSVIPLAVQAAEAVGIPQQDLVPVYQAFGGGGYSQWTVPTPTQEQQILSTWGSVLPNPAFDYAYSWGVQVGDTALSTDPGLQQVFAAHNASWLKVGGNGAGGTLDRVTASNAKVEVEANSNVQLTGSTDTVKIDPEVKSNLILSGSSDTVAASAFDAISLTSGTGDTITGAGLTVAAGTGTGLKVGGNGAGGTVDNVQGSRTSVEVEANSNVQLTGSNDAVKIDAGVKSNLILSGSSDAVAASAGDAISLTSGTGDTITGAGFTISTGTATTFTIVGTGDVVYAGLNEAITDGGSAITIKIQSNVGRLKVFGFGTDRTGTIDLLNGVGGYTNSAQVLGALTTDGSGGSLLSLGGNGSIDFVHVAASSLHAGNFKIG
jgi:Phosphoesterase family/Bacterial Ig-like domain